MKINWKKLIIIILITFVVGSFFSIFTMNNMDTYKEISKPFEVPSIVFPIVWTILYFLMSISCYVISESDDENRKKALTIYAIQLIFNSLWTLIFFGFGNYVLSFVWIVILDILVIYMIIEFYKINKRAGLLQIPYLIWIIFASYLNLMIAIMN